MKPLVHGDGQALKCVLIFPLKDKEPVQASSPVRLGLEGSGYKGLEGSGYTLTAK